ncbi:hypothetical protein DSO57_1010837 [Entomophthora muscae]|uniref:Uncharacterized protein n=1 Tax=Entomophthora muscae TaxID=34485 RepID=A0ACC2RXF3_9FUNG|nr:hypothetical protein DSO57_1010837 [Entomophthora muscae]
MCISTILYNLTHLLLLATKSNHFALHAGDFSYSPLLTVPPAQDFSKLGLVYITVLGLANQAVPHTGSWCSLATEVNYLTRIAPIEYLAFQARPASPMGAQLDSGMGHDMIVEFYLNLKSFCLNLRISLRESFFCVIKDFLDPYSPFWDH